MVAQIDTKFIRARPWKLWSRLLAYALFEGRPLTTRGRWINPLVFAGYRLWSVLPLRKRDLRPIFVMGVGRSGTTVLGTILALHPDVGYLNEPKALWHAALGDDDGSLLVKVASLGVAAVPGRMQNGGKRAGAKRQVQGRRYVEAGLRLEEDFLDTVVVQRAFARDLRAQRRALGEAARRHSRSCVNKHTATREKARRLGQTG